jgi:hypothetical protein
MFTRKQKCCKKSPISYKKSEMLERIPTCLLKTEKFVKKYKECV